MNELYFFNYPKVKFHTFWPPYSEEGGGGGGGRGGYYRNSTISLLISTKNYNDISGFDRLMGCTSTFFLLLSSGCCF